MPRITEARRNAQRARILDAALTCFDRNGFHRTTMQDIVSESELSPGAIYGYFDSKVAIVEAVGAERHQLERELLAEALHSADPIAGMITFVKRYFAWLGDSRELRSRRVAVQVWAEALHDTRMRASVDAGLAPLPEIVRAIRGAKRRKRVPSTVNPEGLARVLLALIQGFVLQQAWQSDVDINGYRDTVLAMLESSLARVPSGPRVFRKNRVSKRASGP
jgi:AcrR family transcriptional regulator